MKMPLAKLKKYFVIDKLIYHSMDLRLCPSLQQMCRTPIAPGFGNAGTAVAMTGQHNLKPT